MINYRIICTQNTMKIVRRHISLMLALRYLNPLRSVFSIITLICLMGVALGVMVLIVVLSVMEGLQNAMEDRVLAFTPHYIISKADMMGARTTIRDKEVDWEMVVDKIQQIPGVVAAYPLLENEAIVQNDVGQKICRYTAIQSHNESQIAPLKKMIREGSFDFGDGFNEECVISFPLARALNLQIGDQLHLTPAESIDELAEVVLLSQKPLFLQENKQFMQDIQSLIPTQSPTSTNETAANKTTQAQDVQTTIILDAKKIASIHETLISLDIKKLRVREIEICKEFYQILQQHGIRGSIDPLEAKKWQQLAQQLAQLDRDKETGKALRNINELIMPVDLNIIGIYQTPENMPGPDVFLPLSIAQDILGYSLGGNSQIQGISIRMKDAYDQSPIEAQLADILPKTSLTHSDDSPRQDIFWTLTPWTESLAHWYKLIANERTMMSFVLSIISLISAFCIMAVMFTMSMQRRREIAVMQALGATPWMIMRIFVWQGLIIGFAGAILGVIFALLVLHFRLEIQLSLAALGLDPFPMDAHGISLPAAYNLSTFVRQAGMAFIMVSVAAVIPAYFVSRQDPAKALRSN